MSLIIEEVMPLHGTFKDGVVVLNGGVTLPEGTDVVVTLAQAELREEFTFWDRAGAEAWQLIAKWEAEEGSDPESLA